MLNGSVEDRWVMWVGVQMDVTRMQVRTAISAVGAANPESPVLEDLKALAKRLSAAASEFEGVRKRAVQALEEGTDD